ncbi:hypothetical protein ENUP19_0082G0026 [Entamoeba nuttalli]|uniref:RNA polymerase Rpb3/Rpb11 dimerization domain containing protein n=2 Tax=Entamoeba nuttalli TaxID=412467 RepID=K2I0V3_ENTNP|nr:RNA polymerase Rpb3/Rpb11 dimerization domain containing protein [Entamoeba nuttalli P19]EKE42390.1 RNA polymerase Rpb3/Rpb11 dimerization domain containing protein [Entamoeba nuttalli P19]|eukprot:XP_008855271.1 RNA polymerase Rpb3/Rpb11 dimerization domain containing protein [Entamoeba nuttalli P19]
MSNGISYTIEGEDHTFANPLRHVIANLPDTDLCGYSIPHPSDTKVVFRIQTQKSSKKTPFDVMEDGCKELIRQMDELNELYEAAF